MIGEKRVKREKFRLSNIRRWTSEPTPVFGFRLAYFRNGHLEESISVELPHQCDEWEILDQESLDLAEAGQRLKTFLAEASVVLALIELSSIEDLRKFAEATT